MTGERKYRIEVAAAQALAEWKAHFAEQVALKAKELAKESGSSDIITLAHYRQAASFAVERLATFVQDTESSDGHQGAA